MKKWACNGMNEPWKTFKGKQPVIKNTKHSASIYKTCVDYVQSEDQSGLLMSTGFLLEMAIMLQNRPWW